jgi:hypothetical protein
MPPACTNLQLGCQADFGTMTCAQNDDTLMCVDYRCDGVAATDATACTNRCTAGSMCTAGNIVSPVTPSTSSSNCFPASATVQLESGATVTMAELEIGASVLAAPGVYSKVYMFSHRLAETKTAFVALETASGASLLLTPDHYLHINGSLAAASTVQIGHLVTLADGSKATVSKVSKQWAAGLYNPHTLHGDIVVDGVQTSTYTQGIAPAVAHAALWPVRALFAAGVEVSADTFAHGSELLIQLLPNGQEKY